jgi:MFS family permease
MAFGLLSIFIPLYIIAIGGSLLDLGILSAVALFLAIPASFFWGYVSDKTRHYKRYILISFFVSTLFLYLFTFTTSVGLLIILYAIMSIFHVAHESPKNVLVAELYSREDWERTFALYEGFTEIGWLIGLLLGFFMSAYGFTATSELLLCSGLNLVAFILSLILLTDPILIFERGLVNIEKTIEFTSKGVVIASKLLDGVHTNETVKKENLQAFFSGLILFSVATSTLFTPLPIFFSKELALSTSIVFAVYALNSSGGVLGYLLVSRSSVQSTGKSPISRIVIFRTILTLLLVVAAQASAYNVILAIATLTLMGFAYAFFLIYTLSLSMELIPAGKAGLFNVLLGIGGASGSFIGPFLAQTLGFTSVFLMTSFMFLLSYISFKIFT